MRRKSLDIQVSGAGLANFQQLQAEQLTFVVSGSGVGRFAGAVQSLEVQISGRGEFIAPRLQTQSARMNVSGLVRVKVWANEELDANVSVVDSIDYWGEPPRGHRRLTGVGSVQSRGGRRRLEAEP